MTYVKRKIIHGKPNYYLLSSKRVGKKVKKKTVAYLGTNPAIAELREKLADLTKLESETIIKQLKSFAKRNK